MPDAIGSDGLRDRRPKLPERHARVNRKRGGKIIAGTVSSVRNQWQIHILAHFISTLFTPVAGPLSAAEVCERIRHPGLRSIRIALAAGRLRRRP
jgi:hypothetical protein